MTSNPCFRSIDGFKEILAASQAEQQPRCHYEFTVMESPDHTDGVLVAVSFCDEQGRALLEGDPIIVPFGGVVTLPSESSIGFAIAKAVS